MRKKNALVIGIANEDSISAGIAEQLYTNGYHIMPTYLNEKALPHVKQVTDRFAVQTLFPFQVGNTDQLEAIIDYLKEEGMRLDVVIHGIAFASEIKKDLHAVTWKSFKDSVRISAFSMVEIVAALLKADVLNPGSCVVTLSYVGSHLAVEGYNMMGPVKSVLEALVRGLASELGAKGIRVNAVSPGPVMTRAASGIKGFSSLIKYAQNASPLGRTATLADIARMAFEIVTNPSINGAVYLVDDGSSVVVNLPEE
jgi:enoyl-[acyl-carrier protein] reductase I